MVVGISVVAGLDHLCCHNEATTTSSTPVGQRDAAFPDDLVIRRQPREPAFGPTLSVDYTMPASGEPPRRQVAIEDSLTRGFQSRSSLRYGGRAPRLRNSARPGGGQEAVGDGPASGTDRVFKDAGSAAVPC